jgi:two-component system chemotaxis response regulator CheY
MKLKTLIVEDEKDAMKLLQMVLEENPSLVLDSAWDGAEALQKIQLNQYELIVTDWNMPNMSGLEFLQALRKNQQHSSTPVIMLTGMHELEKLDQAINAGMTDFLTKPFEPAHLLQTIDRRMSRMHSDYIVSASDFIDNNQE